MSKYISLSFDDGRMDTYDTAIPILQKYGLSATINIVSDFVLHPERYDKFGSAANLAMSIDNVVSAQKMGFEIACHGHKHANTIEDIHENILQLKKWGIDTQNIGFSSPFSYITKDNIDEIIDLKNNGELSYIRSGIQVKREGIMYKAGYVLQNVMHSKRLFYLLNKPLLGKYDSQCSLFYGISISKFTTMAQLEYLINRIPEGSFAILIFHSILDSSDVGYDYDKWYWERDDFDSLCRFLSQGKDLRVVSTRSLLKERAICI